MQDCKLELIHQSTNGESTADLFERFVIRAKMLPEATAISLDDGHSCSYQCLLEQSNQIARLLTERLGTQTNPVALIILPSIEYVATILACVQVGISYISLDQNYPLRYIQQILNKAQAKWLLHCDQALAEQFAHVNTLDIRINSQEKTIQRQSNDGLYIVFTSGTTGEPKGVVATQAALLNLVDATIEPYHIGPGDRVPLFHPINFDFSCWELFATILNGGTLLIPNEDKKRDLQYYFHYIVAQRATIANMTPGVFYLFIMFLKQQSIPTKNLALRAIILGGDKLDLKICQSWLQLPHAQGCQLYNMYGISEGTIHSTIKAIDSNIPQYHSAIGSPLKGIEVVVMDEWNSPIEQPGQAGELWLGGRSLAKGYCHDSALTQQVFINRSFHGKNSQRWFKTGDIVTWSTEGELLYLYRKDTMVKIRGHRIYPNEIEQMLMQHPSIQQAVVFTSIQDNHTQLCACITPQQHDMQAIKNFLRIQLPEYMQPAFIQSCTTLPLNLNGKVDKSTLLQSFEAQLQRQTSHTQATTIKDKITACWKQVLNQEHIDEKDNFFDIGGDSLRLVQLQFRLQKVLKRPINLLDIAQYPSIERLTQYLE